MRKLNADVFRSSVSTPSPAERRLDRARLAALARLPALFDAESAEVEMLAGRLGVVVEIERVNLRDGARVVRTVGGGAA